ncbi:uncharacterized protein LOC141597305 [Silene latifolia]|uniref:uncharacterized protein LOC141597305 n=1 Tax=Silene latifolia TaxID=37657 RepID=UPI003D781C2A
MSRCFPFSSSGYARNCSSNHNDALIVSIKLQEQTEKPIPDRVKENVKSSDKKDRKSEKKDRKSEKKDRKKDKKEKKDTKRVEKEQLHSAIESGKQKPDDKLYKADAFEKESKGKRSFEVLERSNLTEEHGRPVDPQNVSCSSDSTGNSSKRKRVSSPPSSIQGNGNIIRIRISSKKRDEPSTSCIIPPRKTEDHSKSQANLQPRSVSVPVISQTNVIAKVREPQANLRPCSVSVPVISQTNVIAKAQEPRANLRPSSVSVPVISQTNVVAKVQEPVRVVQETKVEPLASREEPSTSGRIEIREPPSKKVKKLSSHERKLLKKETLYNTLFQNLAPPTLMTEQVVGLDDDDDWLFGKKDDQPAKKLRHSDDVQQPASMDNLSCSGSAVLQPRAHFLSDVGIYALPFTVPF